MKLEGKSAIITGAGRGLGRAIARAMSREGAMITILSRSVEDLESVDRSIKDRGGECLLLQGDVSRPDDVERVAKEAMTRFSTKEKGELKDPAKVALLAVFLASTEADQLTGYFGSLTDYEALGWIAPETG